MNKIFAVLFTVFFFSGLLHAQNFVSLDVSDRKVLEEINGASSRLDNVKSKKERAVIIEEIAKILTSAKQYAAAENVYKRLLEEKPSKKKQFSYYVSLGDLYALQNNYSLSLDSYKKALALYKKNTAVKLKVGDILIESNLYNLAEQNFLEVLKNDKNSDYAKKRLGDIYYHQDLHAKAWQYYLMIDPQSYTKETIINMAVCCRSLDQTEEGIRLTDDFLKNQESAELFFMSGLLYADKNKYEMAEKQFLNSLRLDENNFSVYVYLAGIYLSAGELGKAREFLDKAYKRNSSYAAIDLMYAEMAFNSGRLYEARRYAHNASFKAKTPFMKDQTQKMIEFLKTKDSRF